MEEAEAYCPPGLPLPKIGHDRGLGITSIRVIARPSSFAPTGENRRTLASLQGDSVGPTIIKSPLPGDSHSRRFVCWASDPVQR
jgi:hypothetical protein